MAVNPSAKRFIPMIALGLLLAALGGFIAMLALRPTAWWSSILIGGLSAATVGALTDYFAVTAVFRKIPVPFLHGRTDIIIRNKAALRHSLVGLLKGKIISMESATAWLRKEPLSQAFAEAADHLDPGSLERTIEAFLRGAVNMVPVEKVSGWAMDTLLPRLAEVDFSAALHRGGDYLLEGDRPERLARFAAGELAKVLECTTTEQIVEGAIAIFQSRYEGLADGKTAALLRSIVAPMAGDAVRKTLAGKITELADRLRELERTGATDGPVQVIYTDLKDKALDALRMGVGNPELPGLIQAFIKEKGADRTAAAGELARFLNGFRNDLLAEGNPRMAGAARFIAESMRKADGRHWFNRLAADHLPVLISHPKVAGAIEDALEAMPDAELRREGSARVAADLAAIRITGTVLGFIAGCAVHGILQLARLL